jgi:hypothetical protein
MSDYRRYRVPGGTYFFTVNLLERYPKTCLLGRSTYFERWNDTFGRNEHFTSTLKSFYRITCTPYGHFHPAMTISQIHGG